MNWLSMLPDEDKRQIVKELASRLSAEPILTGAFESAVDKVFKKYGYLEPPDNRDVKDSPRLTTAGQPLIDLLNKIYEMKQKFFTNEWDFRLMEETKTAADAVAKLYSVKL